MRSRLQQMKLQTGNASMTPPSCIETPFVKAPHFHLPILLVRTCFKIFFSVKFEIMLPKYRQGLGLNLRCNPMSI